MAKKGGNRRQKTFAKHPSISNCIAGIKYGKPFVKVFLMHGDEHGEFYDSNQSLNLEDTQFEYVNVSAQSKKKEEEFEILKGKEKEAPVLPNDIRNKLSEIINRQAEKIYAKHTTVTGIGVSNVRYEGDTLISDPCIVIYCLDALLLPYGGDSGSGVFVIEKGQPSKPLGIAFAFQPNGEITVVCKVNSILDKCKLAICQEEIEMDL